jgi:DNA damage-inducible protein 1
MPRVTISINAPNEPQDTEILNLDLPPGLTLRDLKAFFAAETSFPAPAQHFFLNGRPLSNDDQTLEGAGIGDGEMLAVLIRRPGPEPQRSRPDARRRAMDPEGVRLTVLGNPAAQEQLRQQKPELAAALTDPVRWREMFMMEQRQEEEAERDRQNQIALLNEDPFNVEAQKRIEEIIRQDRVIENLQHAYENNPEVFVRVHMLYINAEVNGHPVKAFVDSGAQATIMSPSCAEACGIMRLIDTRYAGIARGVGTAKILGRVHHAEIKIGGAVMPCAFTVMEGKDVDLLFGLDMLKRYKAKIDLEKNALCFEGIEVPFLPESEIPRSWDDGEISEPTLQGPNNTEIGGRTGAVRPAGATASGNPAAASGPPPARPPTVPSSSSAAPNPAPAEEFPEEKISSLIKLGFSRDQAINALRSTGGNLDYAASLLFPN